MWFGKPGDAKFIEINAGFVRKNEVASVNYQYESNDIYLSFLAFGLQKTLQKVAFSDNERRCRNTYSVNVRRVLQ